MANRTAPVGQNISDTFGYDLVKVTEWEYMVTDQRTGQSVTFPDDLAETMAADLEWRDGRREDDLEFACLTVMQTLPQIAEPLCAMAEAVGRTYDRNLAAHLAGNVSPMAEAKDGAPVDLEDLHTCIVNLAAAVAALAHATV